MFRLALLAVALLAAPVLAQPADTLRLDLTDALRFALDGSPEVAIEEAGVAFAEARAAQAHASRYLTVFQITTGHAYAPRLDVPEDSPFPRDAAYLDPRTRDDWANLNPYNEFDLEFLQPLVTWGEVSGQVRAAEAAVGVERAEVEMRASEVALRTGEVYFGLAAATALGALVGDAESLIANAGTELQARLDDGDPDVTDANLFQLRLLEQEFVARAAEAEQQRLLAASGLARQLGRPGTPVATEPLARVAFPLDALETYQAEAIRHRAVLRQAEAGIAAREGLVRAARSHYYPRLFAGGNLRYRYAAGRERQPNPFIIDPYLGGGIRAGLGIRQDLTFGQTRARVQQAEAELTEVQIQREAAEQLVLFEVEEAYRAVRTAEAALDARTEAARLAGDWLRTEQINADLALGTVQELVQAAQAELQARLALVDATRNYNVSVLRLLAATGRLAADAERGTLFGPLMTD